MLNVQTAPNPKSYYDNGIDLILFEAINSAAYEEVTSDVSLEWLLEYSQINLE